ncbi:MAG: CAAX prenyl protease-related protein [Kiritimatiellae bacterium]|nr:CAAX prenyl protease-related protein [Kiritimatiellia bacterium]
MKEKEKKIMYPLPAPSDEETVVIQNTMWTHVVPFAAWLAIMTLLPTAGWSYAVRSAVCVVLLFWFAPWRWYERLNKHHIPLAFAAGGAVFALWIFPELSFMKRLSGFDSAYQLLGILPPWSRPEALTTFPYAPETCGWTLAIIRLLGSSIVVALLEEFFWRGWMYRWLFKSNFLRVDPGQWNYFAFFSVAILFGLEHDRWLVGILAGMIYGWLYIQTRDIWAACIAHGVTNFLLGLYVLQTGAYQFW